MKTIFTTLLIIAASLTALAQAPSWVWAKSAGNMWYEEATAIAIDASGNTYITGFYNEANPTPYTISFGTSTITSVLGKDAFVAKYDPTGTLLWVRSAGGTGDDLGKGIAVDASGNVYITGQFSSTSMVFDTVTISTTAFNDAFIAKYNSSGDILWAKKVGGAGGDYGYSIGVDAASNCYITGYFNSSTVIIGSSTLSNPFSGTGGYQFFIAKYDAFGNPVWGKATTSSSQSTGNDIAVDAAGNSYVTGFFSSAATFDAISLTGAGKDIFIAKYDPSGTAVWAKSANGTAEDMGMSIAIDASGNSYMTGYFKGNSIVIGGTTLTNSGAPDSDILVAKYDVAGTMLWVKKPVAYGFDMPLGIAVDALGDCYVTGYFKGSSIIFGTTTLFSSGATGPIGDFFTATYSTTGTAMWAKNLVSSAGAWGAGVVVDAVYATYYTGFFEDLSLAFGSTTLNASNREIYIAKLGPSSTVGIDGVFSNDQMIVFPNPATGSVTFTHKNNSKVELSNVFGVVIYTAKADGEQTTLDVSHYATGTYFLKIVSDVGSVTKKIVIR